MQRIFSLIASALIPLSSLPLAAAAAEHPRVDRPVVRERAAPGEEALKRPIERPVERPVLRAEAPRSYARVYSPRTQVRHEQMAPPRVQQYAPRAIERPIVRREMVPRRVFREAPRQEFRQVQPRRFVEPRVTSPQRFERRSNFVRYYSPRYFTGVRERQRIAFRRYVPRRLFVAPQVQIVRSYYAQPAYVRTASLPVVTPVYYNAPVQLPLPIAWTPATYGPYYDNGNEYSYNNYPSYGQYNPYSPYQQYPYGNQYPVGYNGPFGMNPFGNAQLQGIVISSTNAGVLVLTPNLQPVFVNLSIAQQNGYINGNISPGSFVNVFGYNTGNEFIATALS